MSQPRFNRSRPYAEVHNADDDPTLRNVRFQQNGHCFDARGRWIPADGAGPIPLHDEVSAYDREQDEVAAQEERELRALARIWDREWEGVEEARVFFFQTTEPRR